MLDMNELTFYELYAYGFQGFENSVREKILPFKIDILAIEVQYACL